MENKPTHKKTSLPYKITVVTIVTSIAFFWINSNFLESSVAKGVQLVIIVIATFIWKIEEDNR